MPEKNQKEATLKNLGFPAFSILARKDKIFIAGGGGKSKTGIRNCVCWFQQDKKEWKLCGYFEFPSEFGAPMNMAFVKDFLIVGVDEFSHVLRLEDEKLSLKQKFKTDFKENKNLYDESYQKVVVSSSDGCWICTGGTDGVARVWDTRDIGNYFSPTEANFDLKDHKTEINDAAFDTIGRTLATLSSEFVCISTIRETRKPDIELITKLDAKILHKDSGFKFRFVRFGETSSDGNLFTISLDEKRQAYLTKFITKDWKLVKHALVSKRPITAIALSPDGMFLAYGTSEGGVGLVNTRTMRSKWIVGRAHGFTVTSVTFTQQGNQVVSTSADQSCKVFSVNPGIGSIEILLYLLALLVLALAIYLATGRDSSEIIKRFM